MNNAWAFRIFGDFVLTSTIAIILQNDIPEFYKSCVPTASSSPPVFARRSSSLSHIAALLFTGLCVVPCNLKVGFISPYWVPKKTNMKVIKLFMQRRVLQSPIENGR